MINIYPTHTCFDDTSEYLINNFFETGNIYEYTLVHGIRDIDGKKLSHAWIENSYKNKVIDFGIHNGEKVKLTYCQITYYKKFNIIHTTKYTLPESIFCSYMYDKNTGPWKKEYIKLCGDFSGKYFVDDAKFELINKIGKETRY